MCYLTMLLLCWFLVASASSESLPREFELCHFGDVNCIPDAATKFLKLIVNGRQDLQVPRLEPFRVDILNVTQKSGQFSAVLRIIDADIHGFSNVVFDKAVGFEANPEKSRFEIFGRTPELKINGKYSIDGRVFSFPVQGNGNLNCILKDVGIGIKFKPDTLTRNDKTFIKLNKLKMLVTTGKLSIHLSNLFNGDRVLGDTVNNFLNENWSLFWEEIQESFSREATKVVRGIVDSILDRYSYDSFFLGSD